MHVVVCSWLVAQAYSHPESPTVSGDGYSLAHLQTDEIAADPFAKADVPRRSITPQSSITLRYETSKEEHLKVSLLTIGQFCHGRLSWSLICMASL